MRLNAVFAWMQDPFGVEENGKGRPVLVSELLAKILQMTAVAVYAGPDNRYFLERNIGRLREWMLKIITNKGTVLPTGCLSLLYSAPMNVFIVRSQVAVSINE
jgi:hypothetical protein